MNDPEDLPRLEKIRHRPHSLVGRDEDTFYHAFDPDSDLLGAVLMIANKQWDIKNKNSEDHPGACAHYTPGSFDAQMVKGTDAENVGKQPGYLTIQPTEVNGLSKATAFELAPRLLRLHFLRKLFPERHLGRLDDADLKDLHYELARVHPEDE